MNQYSKLTKQTPHNLDGLTVMCPTIWDALGLPHMISSTGVTTRTHSWIFSSNNSTPCSLHDSFCDQMSRLCSKKWLWVHMHKKAWPDIIWWVCGTGQGKRGWTNRAWTKNTHTDTCTHTSYHIAHPHPLLRQRSLCLYQCVGFSKCCHAIVPNRVQC